MEVENIRKLIMSRIDIDLRENYSEDALGNAVYLYFAQKRKITSPAIENLIDWMNNWLQQVLVEKRTSRFIDREVTSAILGYQTLRLLNKLKVTVDHNVLQDLLVNHLRDGCYFGNPTYTMIILLGVKPIHDKISSYDYVLQGIKEKLKTKKILNDSKNVLFGTIIFDDSGDDEVVQNLVQHCVDQMRRNNIRFDDRVFYAWILWNFRRMVDVDLIQIREFVEDTLENLCSTLQGIVTDDSIIDYYGEDVRNRISKFVLGICLDLVSDYASSKLYTTAIDVSLILRILESRGWIEIREMISKAMKNFDNGETKECCENLRMGLISLLVKLFEDKIGKPAPVEPGKTPNPKELLMPFVKKSFITDFQRNIITTSWSYVSELAHVEKRGGIPPSEDETRYGLQLIFSSIELLTRCI